MELEISNIVISLKGRDKGGLFFVTQADDRYVGLADGKSRKLKKPKRKSKAHVRFVSDCAPEIASGIRNGKLSDKAIRKALARYRSGAEIEKEGRTFGKR